MIAAGCYALFASAFVVAVGSIAATIIPQRHRITRILRRGPEWSVDHG
ncbi:hypothetical protein [Sphingomonas sp. Leaf67]|nr:hypothetical protein [Sphingomonas sp. Leaf67]